MDMNGQDRRPNIRIIGADHFINDGKADISNAEISGGIAIKNGETGVMHIEGLETDGMIDNDGTFVGKNLQVFVRRFSKKSLLERIGLLLGLLASIATIVSLFL